MDPLFYDLGAMRHGNDLWRIEHEGNEVKDLNNILRATLC